MKTLFAVIDTRTETIGILFDSKEDVKRLTQSTNQAMKPAYQTYRMATITFEEDPT